MKSPIKVQINKETKCLHGIMQIHVYIQRCPYYFITHLLQSYAPLSVCIIHVQRARLTAVSIFTHFVGHRSTSRAGRDSRCGGGEIKSSIKSYQKHQNSQTGDCSWMSFPCISRVTCSPFMCKKTICTRMIKTPGH